MDNVYMDFAGRYYKADSPKDPGDILFNHPTPDMLKYLTEVPITRVEFEGILLRKNAIIVP